MSTNTLLFEVSGNKIKRVGGFEPTSGERNYTTLKFNLDKSWEDVKNVSVLQFFDPSNIPEPLLIDVNNLTVVCPINPELRHQSGVLMVGLLGVKDGEVTMDTFTTAVPVGQGFRVSGTTNTEFYVRLLEYLKTLNELLITEDNPVTSELLAEGAVLERHLAEGAITTRKILKGAVTPETLDRDYLRLYGAQSMTGELLHGFLTTNVKESREPDKKIYILDCDGKNALETVGKGRCVCYYVSASEFYVHNLASGKQYIVTFNDNEITSVEEVNVFKLGVGDVTPNNLDRTYLEARSTGALPGDAFHNFLLSGIRENGDHLKTIHLFVSRGDGILENVGAGRCKGFYVNSTRFTFENLNTNKVYQVVFTDEGITSITEKYADIADASILRKHLSDSLLIPDKMLEEKYWKIKGYSSATSYADLDAVFDDEDLYDTIYQFKFSGFSPMADLLGSDDYIAIASSETDILILINRTNRDRWSYEKGSNTVEKIEDSVDMSAIEEAISSMLTKKDIELDGGSNGDEELKRYVNCVGTVYGGATYSYWYESYSTVTHGPVMDNGLNAFVVQYKTYFDGPNAGKKYRRLNAHDGVEDIWTDWEEVNGATTDPIIITPEALDREYLRLNLFANVVDDSSFLTLLNSNISESESEEHFKKAVLFVIRQTSEGQLTSIIGAGRCFGFYVSKQEFWFTNLKTNKVYSAVFNEDELVSVSYLAAKGCLTYDSNSSDAQSGIAVAEALDAMGKTKMPGVASFDKISAIGENADPELLAYQTKDPSAPSYLRVPVSVLIKPMIDDAVAGALGDVETLLSKI